MKPRVLYFIVAYPNFSETYMHEEMRALREKYDIEVITYRADANTPRKNAYPFRLIPYTDPCLVYGDIRRIDRSFSSPTQQKFLDECSKVIEDFKPDLLHAHYLGVSALLEKLSNRHRIPFTVRTHSMDVLSEPPEKLKAFNDACNGPWCLRILAFPENCKRLVAHGFDPAKVVSCWPVMNFARFHKPEGRKPTKRVLCAGPCTPKKAHKDFVDLASRMRGSGFEFHLYTAGPFLPKVRERNSLKGNPVNLTYADPDEMPEIYPRFDWLVYPSDPTINKVGLPLAIPEAQASGLGVCWQELPGRRQEQLDFLGGAGFLFQSIDEVPRILTQPYPESMRQAGFVAARRSSIEDHQHLLTEVWDAHFQVVRQGSALSS